MLADWAVRGGVQSTTRYRKGNPVRRCGPTAHHGPIPTRASAGRKSGASISKNRTVGPKRSMLSRSTNPDMLSRHVAPFRMPMYDHQSLSYDYSPDSHPMSSDADWMGSPHDPAAALPTTNYELSGYTYSSPLQTQTIGGLSQHDHVQAVYPTADIMGAYGGSHLPANPRVHSQHMAISPHYNNLFPNSRESGDRPDYFPWSQTAGGDACT